MVSVEMPMSLRVEEMPTRGERCAALRPIVLAGDSQRGLAGEAAGLRPDREAQDAADPSFVGDAQTLVPR